MKAILKNGTGRLLIEVQGETVKDLVRQIAIVQEVIDADDICGACGSSHIRFRVRVVEKYEYFELVCEACTARLAFGQLREGGGLFPKRRGEDNAPLANRGWLVYLGAAK